FRPRRLEVVRRQVAAQRAHALRDAAAELAAIQRADPLPGDEPQGAREVGVTEPFAGPRGPVPFYEIGRARTLVLPQPGDLGAPLGADDRGDRKPLLGVTDGRCGALRQSAGPDATE